jgi:hypothetical protein
MPRDEHFTAAKQAEPLSKDLRAFFASVPNKQWTSIDTTNAPQIHDITSMARGRSVTMEMARFGLGLQRRGL